jgi:hypothetical protein
LFSASFIIVRVEQSIGATLGKNINDVSIDNYNNSFCQEMFCKEEKPLFFSGLP